MKTAQSTILRWVAKLVGQPARAPRRGGRDTLRTLDADQLRQVSGGTGTSTQDGPNKGW